MSYFTDPPSAPAATPQDLAAAVESQHVGFGEAFATQHAPEIGASIQETGRLKPLAEQAPVDAAGNPNPDYADAGALANPLGTPTPQVLTPEQKALKPVRPEDAAAIVGQRKIDVSPYDTPVSLQAKVDQQDHDAWTAWVADQRKAGTAEWLLNQAASIPAAFTDPLSYIPMGGEAWRAAMVARGLGRAAQYGLGAALGAGEMVGLSAAALPLQVAQARALDDDASYARALQDMLLSPQTYVVGGLGGVAGTFGFRRAHAPHPAEALPGVVPAPEPAAPDLAGLAAAVVEKANPPGGDQQPGPGPEPLDTAALSGGPARFAPEMEGGPLHGYAGPNVETGDRLMGAASLPALRSPTPEMVATEAGRVNTAMDAVLHGEPVDVADIAPGHGIEALHASPHLFDEFDLSKRGTGEGVAAYGEGAYFSDINAPGIHESYLKQFSAGERYTKVERDGQPFEPEGMVETLARNAVKSAGNEAAAQAEWFAEVRRMAERSPYATFTPEDVDAAAKLAPSLTAVRGANSYRVHLDVDPARVADWDKPLTAQPHPVKDAFRAAGLDIEAELKTNMHLTGEQAYNILAKKLGSQLAASRALQEAGLHGIKHLDAGSRLAGEGTHNFVVFDQNRIRILERNGEAVDAHAKGAGLDLTPEERTDAAEAMADGHPVARAVLEAVQDSMADGFRANGHLLGGLRVAVGEDGKARLAMPGGETARAPEAKAEQPGHADLTEAERQQLASYKDLGYLSQRFLVDGKLAHDERPKAEAQAKTLDAALAKLTTGSDATVYRGINTGEKGGDPRALVGKEMPAERFQSSTTDRALAREYAGAKQTEGGGGGVLLEMHVPAGSHGAWLDRFGKEGRAAENELLLPRGGVFTVTAAGREGNVTVLTGEWRDPPRVPAPEPAPAPREPTAAEREAAIKESADHARTEAYVRERKGPLSPKGLAEHLGGSEDEARRQLDRLAARGEIRKLGRKYVRPAGSASQQSALDYIARNGGIDILERRDFRDDVDRFIPGAGKVFRHGAPPSDSLLQSLIEGGYLHEGATDQDAVELVERDATAMARRDPHGRVYPAGEDNDRSEALKAEAEHDRAGQYHEELDAHLAETGIELTPEQRQSVVGAMMLDGLDASDATDHLFSQAMAEDFREGASRIGESDGGVPFAAAEGAGLDPAGAGGEPAVSGGAAGEHAAAGAERGEAGGLAREAGPAGPAGAGAGAGPESAAGAGDAAGPGAAAPGVEPSEGRTVDPETGLTDDAARALLDERLRLKEHYPTTTMERDAPAGVRDRLAEIRRLVPQDSAQWRRLYDQDMEAAAGRGLRSVLPFGVRLRGRIPGGHRLADVAGGEPRTSAPPTAPGSPPPTLPLAGRDAKAAPPPDPFAEMERVAKSPAPADPLKEAPGQLDYEAARLAGHIDSKDAAAVTRAETKVAEIEALRPAYEIAASCIMGGFRA